jgi:hypothetical protein
MKTKLLSGLILLGLFSAFTLPAAQGATPAPVSASAGEIKVTRIRGEVFVTDNTTKVKTQIQSDRSISQGSTVSTAKDSSVVLFFSNGASVSLGKESVLDIEQFTQDPFSGKLDAASLKEEPTHSVTKLNLTRGELVGKVAKLKKEGGSSFTVTTPVGAAGIRGTVFQIVYIPDGNGKATFSLTTLEGAVVVSLNTTGSVTVPVTVTDSKQVSVSVTVTQDPVTGVTTVTVPPSTPGAAANTFTVAPASSGSTQAIADVTQQIIQAVANIVVLPPTPPPAAPAATTTPPPVDPQGG